MAEQKSEAQRQARSPLTRFERWALPRLAAALPAWVTPDHLTALGMLAASGIALAYVASNRDAAWLWAASALFVVHWFGDSLDGSLARYRQIERPNYGFYLDHLVDAYSTLMIGLGLGWSPYMLLATGLVVVLAYLLVSINVYLETIVFGKFKYTYGRLGPTEVRVILIGLNTLAVLVGPLPFSLLGYGATIYDLFGLAAAAVMVGLLLSRTLRNLRELALREPPGVRRPRRET
jgi:phosphatidylglycerophosphate synthase